MDTCLKEDTADTDAAVTVVAVSMISQEVPAIRKCRLRLKKIDLPSSPVEDCQVEKGNNKMMSQSFTPFVIRDKYSGQQFMCTESLLCWRGRRYSEKDIARVFKKDCRMWLWKNRVLAKAQSEKI